MKKNTKNTSTDDYRYQIDIWQKAYNIVNEKKELFFDILISLHELIDNTYLGNDIIITDQEQRGHFDWCWKKIVKDLEKEKIYLKESGQHVEYIWNFFREAYYLDLNEIRKIKIKEYFTILFDLNIKKSKSELDILYEIYKILEYNLKK